MGSLAPSLISKCKEENEEDGGVYKKYMELIFTLPVENGWVSSPLRKYEGYWFFEKTLHAIMAFQEHFKARPTDILLATNPRSGTTWMKALMFAIANRTAIPPDSPNHPLLFKTPQECMLFTELHYAFDHIPDLDVLLPSPRLLSTHIPYSLLPESIKDSGCRIIYFFRNPKDNLVSQWQFFDKLRAESMESLTLEKAFELFSAGISMFGPLWDNTLEYWKEKLRMPERVLFLRYEDMKKDPTENLKRVAEFMGCPFTPEEESQGLVKGILELCSFEHLKNLEVNKTGSFWKKNMTLHNAIFFRKAEVGQWATYLSPEMIKRLDEIAEQKLGGPGLLNPIDQKL